MDDISTFEFLGNESKINDSKSIYLTDNWDKNKLENSINNTSINSFINSCSKKDNLSKHLYLNLHKESSKKIFKIEKNYERLFNLKHTITDLINNNNTNTDDTLKSDTCISNYLANSSRDSINIDSTKTRKSNNFNEKEKYKLAFLKNKFPNKSWKELSYHLPGKTSFQIRKQWVNSLAPGIKKGKWTAEENSSLISQVSLFSSDNLNLVKIKGRTKKQIREHWHEVMKTKLNENSINHTKSLILVEDNSKNNIKLESNRNIVNDKDEKCNHNNNESPTKSITFNNTTFDDDRRNMNQTSQNTFSFKDENNLLLFFQQYGPKWSAFTNIFKGFSSNNIKNKFYSLLRKEVNRCFNEVKVKKQFSYKEISENNKIIDSFFDSSQENTKIGKNENNNNSLYNNNNLNTNSANVLKDSNGNARKRSFMCKSELIRYIPYILKIRGVNVKESLSTSKNFVIKPESQKLEKIEIKNIEDLVNVSESQLMNQHSISFSNKKRKIASNNSNFSECQSNLLKNNIKSKIFDLKKDNSINAHNLDPEIDHLLEYSNFFEFTDKTLSAIDLNLDNNLNSELSIDLENKKRNALRKAIELINNKKLEIKRNQVVNNLKSGILMTYQVDILSKIVSRIKTKALSKTFNIFKAKTNDLISINMKTNNDGNISVLEVEEKNGK